MQAEPVFIGVDAAKAELVIAAHEDAIDACAIANGIHSIDRWLSTVPQAAVLGVESTGRYHGLLAQRAHARGVKVYVLNARDVYFYARALGTRGKTDRVDARVIARYVAEHHARLHAWQPPTAVQQEVEELLRRRAQAVKYQVALRQTFQACRGLSQAAQRMQSQFKSLLQAIDKRIDELLLSDAKLVEDRRRLSTVTGVGPLGSAMLTVLFNRVPFANADAVVAYSGLDPRPRDSGTKRGRRHLSKRGPAALRRQVYLMGFTASHSKALKPLYNDLRERGLASTEAMVILGRKLLRVAFAVWKRGVPFDAIRLLGKND